MPNASSRNGSAPNDSSSTRQTFLYFGALTLFIYMATPAGYLVDIQTSYMLKNQLHATATEISPFRLITAIPIYFAFIFGLIRDQWNPFGMRDRGFFLIFAPATVAAFIWMANARLSYSGLLAGMLLLMVLSRFLGAAYQGLIALVGPEKLMSGRLAVLWNVVSSFPVLAGALASGFISRHLPPNQTFVIAAALTAVIAVSAFCGTLRQVRIRRCSSTSPTGCTRQTISTRTTRASSRSLSSRPSCCMAISASGCR